MSTREPVKRGMAALRPHLANRRTQLLLDTVVLSVAFLLAYALRYDFAIPEKELPAFLLRLPVVIVLELLALRIAGVYRFVWRYVGMSELRAFGVAALLSAAPLAVLRLMLPEQAQVLRIPLSIILLNMGLALGGTLAMRVLRRGVYERYEKRRQSNSGAEAGRKKRVLLAGAGRAGVMTAREIQGRGDLDIEIAGFVDDDPLKQKSVISGVKVLGTTEDLPRLVAEHRINHVVISMVQAPRKEFKRILEVCERIPVKVRVIPGLFEILQGRVNVSRIRDLEIEDLLGREPVRLDEGELERFLTGRVVLVTGAGGSIGSELVRQVARLKPASILLVERSEPALFNIDRELRGTFPDVTILPLVADVCDEARMRYIFSSHRPHVVLHAAAHKHVPMMELNPTESVKNNSLATRLVGELAGVYGVETFVLISTDKAVRPTSVMGASKRVAELIVQWLNERYETHYVAVRFGNVIGSTGSVIPLFREQIARGGPVTVTHPDMVRYFMTIPEASQLVLQAGAMGEGGEIFVLDMGEPVSILELAKDTIMLSGFKPYEEIEIVFTGLRPGEKLFEELEMTGENVAKTRHPKIFIGKISAHPSSEVGRAIDRLQALSTNGHHHELCTFLGELLPESQLSINQPRADGTHTSSDETSHLVAMPGR
jgi:FlaA1/EpsC-like NDP-sugar epimerase